MVRSLDWIKDRSEGSLTCVHLWICEGSPMELLATSSLFTPYVRRSIMISEIVAKNPSMVGDTQGETPSDAESMILSVAPSESLHCLWL
jgi:hypothetical protein